MLEVEDYERIRRAVLVHGMSQREASRELGLSRKTIRKALAHARPPGYRREQPVTRPAIDPVKDFMDAWMEEDLGRPRKQRHTGERIHQTYLRQHDKYISTISVSYENRGTSWHYRGAFRLGGSLGVRPPG